VRTRQMARRSANGCGRPASARVEAMRSSMDWGARAVAGWLCRSTTSRARASGEGFLLHADLGPFCLPVDSSTYNGRSGAAAAASVPEPSVK
jgi:hypothetical protein